MLYSVLHTLGRSGLDVGTIWMTHFCVEMWTILILHFDESGTLACILYAVVLYLTRWRGVDHIKFVDSLLLRCYFVLNSVFYFTSEEGAVKTLE